MVRIVTFPDEDVYVIDFDEDVYAIGERLSISSTTCTSTLSPLGLTCTRLGRIEDLRSKGALVHDFGLDHV